MSRRLPASPLFGILLLLFAGALFSPFIVTPVAAFGERVYDANQVINAANHLNVYSGESVAQSFVASDAYRLLNLTLRLKNNGDTTDAVNVSIRPDAGGVPAGTTLAVAQIVIGTTTLGNYNVPFASPPAAVVNVMRSSLACTVNGNRLETMITRPWLVIGLPPRPADNVDHTSA